MEKLTDKSFEELYKSVSKLDSFLENSEFGSETYNDAEFIKRDFGFAIAEKAEDRIKECARLKESGIITESYYNELCEDLMHKLDYGRSVATPYCEEADNALAITTTIKEVATFGSVLYNLASRLNVGEILTLPIKKYILKRLSKYPLLYQNAVDFRQLKSEKYTISEMYNKFNVKSVFAEKWQQNRIRTDCKAYLYNDKPVMCIFYTKPKSSANTSNKNVVDVEALILDSKFKKHEDYYVACMATSHQLSHPAASRVLKKLKERWKTELKRQKSAVKESVSDAIIDGSINKKLQYIEEAVKFEVIDKETADIYLRFIDKVQFDDLM